MKTLFQFARKYCANMDNGQCVIKDSVCPLSKGKPCRYFEKAVWPNCDPSYRYATATTYFPALRDEYALFYGKVKRDEVRKCECGEPLKKRQRLCEKCRQKNRRMAWRRQKSKQAG